MFYWLLFSWCIFFFLISLIIRRPKKNIMSSNICTVDQMKKKYTRKKNQKSDMGGAIVDFYINIQWDEAKSNKFKTTRSFAAVLFFHCVFCLYIFSSVAWYTYSIRIWWANEINKQKTECKLVAPLDNRTIRLCLFLFIFLRFIFSWALY